MTLTAKLDWNWSSFQLANSAPPLSVTDSAIAPSARMISKGLVRESAQGVCVHGRFWSALARILLRSGACVSTRRVWVAGALRRRTFDLQWLVAPALLVVVACWAPGEPAKIRKVTLMRPFHGNL